VFHAHLGAPPHSTWYALRRSAGCYGRRMGKGVRAESVRGSGGGRSPIGACLAAYRFGRGDPTTRLAPGEFWRASFTPFGPATIRIAWDAFNRESDAVDAEAWGAGREWMLERATAMTGALDPGFTFADAHPAVLRAQRNHPIVRFGASQMLFHELVPTIIAQRITSGEAIRQWHRLCRHLGEAAPGPAAGLLLPPSPAMLAGRPAWWYHPLGIEAKRAEALRTVGKHADKLWAWAELAPGELSTKLALLPGIGAWTIGSVMASAIGDANAVAVGDFHLKNLVSCALDGQPRGTDERMLELLAPYDGQRGRVVRLLQLDGHRPPAFGPRQRILPMARW
jgi:3-methyladenine DNA glycosylase/8-oxoguanine DNA glycosylase